MKKKIFKNIFETAKEFIKKNDTQILTAVAITSSISALVLTGKATIKAVRIVDEYEIDKGEPLTKKEIVKTTWKCYVPAVLSEMASVACMVGAHNAHSKKNAAIATAYQLTTKAFSEYREQATEILGKEKEKEIKKKVSSKQMKETTPPKEDKSVIIIGNSDQLCYDSASGGYFKSNMDAINKSINNMNKRMMSENYISLNELCCELGEKPTKIGNSIGWNIDDGLIEISFDSEITEDGQTALVITYSNDPKYDFNKFA